MSDNYDGPAMAQQIRKLQAEVAHWKANHASEVQRARILKERTDIPIERVRAYEQWGKDQAERDALRDLYNELLFAVGNAYPNETRHQTALRYITQAETTAYDAAREVQK